MLVNLLHHGLLLDDNSVQVDDHVGELGHLLLNLQELLVTVLHFVQDSTGLALAVALHHGLLEDLLSTSRHVLYGGANLASVGVRAHNTVLTLHLALHLLTVGSLELLVLLNTLLQLAIKTVDLTAVALSLLVALQLLESLNKSSVVGHSLGGKLVELAGSAGRGIGFVECSVLQHPQLVQVLVDSIDTVANISDLVEGIGSPCARGGLGKRGHLDIVAWQDRSVSFFDKICYVSHLRLTVAAAVAATTTIVLLWRAIVLLRSTAILTSWVILLGVGVRSSTVSVDDTVSTRSSSRSANCRRRVLGCSKASCRSYTGDGRKR